MASISAFRRMAAAPVVLVSEPLPALALPVPVTLGIGVGDGADQMPDLGDWETA